ncbi:hypothetical protein HDE_02248 [Halotydeus destructor]|nr:hypothetical protein HDE_02248 [Halotydeus destructor]
MSDARKKSPWYIGWSNCDPEIASRLRTFYQRPYFLPTSSESSRLDWIFMGTAGHGAHMHVDSVGYVSWQAQLRGRKKWTIEPPSECWLSCDKFQVTLEPGDIIVLDTDKWYHQTEILDGDTSVTIGSEYD